MSEQKVVNRRYTIRAFKQDIPAVIFDVSLHGAGPGTDWIRKASVDSHIDAIGPRGKVTLVSDMDWHLFIADETGIPGALAMMESIEGPSTAHAIFEVDAAENEQKLANDGTLSENKEKFDLRWLHRNGQSVPGDQEPLLDALATMTLPEGIGHVYVAGEVHVVRAIQSALFERGCSADQLSAKPYWRRGLANAEHGEPMKEG
jgi:NADPH-dependent ferric siderophore reductase